MGQVIEVKTTKLNKTIIFELNRSVSGQEGMTFSNISEASLISDVSGKLALKLFLSVIYSSEGLLRSWFPLLFIIN